MTMVEYLKGEVERTKEIMNAQDECLAVYKDSIALNEKYIDRIEKLLEKQEKIIVDYRDLFKDLRTIVGTWQNKCMDLQDQISLADYTLSQLEPLVSEEARAGVIDMIKKAQSLKDKYNKDGA